MEEVIEEELRNIVSTFQRGKSLGPDGFTLEFFLGFYDLIKDDLLMVVSESQRTGKFLGAMNATFITLIPKKRDTFEDFRPISCYNIVYKIIAKIIA